jgi:hypothetical protein
MFGMLCSVTISISLVQCPGRVWDCLILVAMEDISSFAPFPEPITIYKRPRNGIRFISNMLDRTDDNLFGVQSCCREYTQKKGLIETAEIGDDDSHWAFPLAG